ncbi:hypothetical protein PV327_004702 [Microctonus hyperodae]|uniref:PHD-type domain-containing protein n=2 Tax=Microctonus hyperodae TaxID=165561 RepID=A0AA39FCZ6_MICHY|nr:hypothetical protein PV327_004702 [Microctonus hyperodae]
MDIASLLEVQVNEGQSTATLGTDSLENKDDIRILKPSQLISNDEMLYYQRNFGTDIAQVRFRRIHCTACDVHIGSAPSEAENMQEHPLLKTLLCARCRDFYGDGNFEQGDDATDMFCRWCANGGNLYCCSYCSNTFCDKCIKRNFDSDVRDKIEADEKWKCFVCDPVDLYSLRALCRAIQNHVATLSRILMADRVMSAHEVEAKMELDDSKCCVGRRSRRRRRESSSGDDSSQRSRSPSIKRNRPKNYHWSNSKRRKSSSQNNDKQNITVLNGTSRFISIAPRYVLQEMVASTAKYRNEEDDLPAPLLHCEQTMVEGDTETVTPQGVILSAKPPSNIHDSVMYNTAVPLNPVASKNVVRGTMTRGGKTIIPIRPIRKIDALPRGATPQVIHRLPNFQSRSSAPMVTIPSIPRSRVDINNTPPNAPIDTTPVNPSNYLRCKSNLTAEPSVIDLESDTDDLVILECSSISNETRLDGNNQTNEATTQKKDSSSSLSEHLRRKIFEETIDNPIVAIDNLLKKLRDRLKLELNSETDIPEDNVVHNARVKIKIINRNIDEIVNELAAFNNSMIRQYHPWKESQNVSENEDQNIKRPIILKPGERSNKYISLNMECVRDSESDVGDDDDIDIEYLLNFSKRITQFDEKDMINRGTMTQNDTEDKATQAYDTVTMDYDKAIGYSLLMRADYDFEQKKETFKPVIIHDKFFGQYEEQFISYLQYFEDHRDFDDDNNEETSPGATLTELIDADIAAAKVTESLNFVCDDTNDNNCEKQIIKVFNHKDNSDEKEKIVTSITKVYDETASEKLVKSTNEIDANNDPDAVIKMTSSQKAKHEETVIAVRALIEEENNDTNVIDKWKNNDDDDECTILE